MKISITEQAFYDAVNKDKNVYVLDHVFGSKGTLSQAVQYYLDNYNKVVRDCDATKYELELIDLKQRLNQLQNDQSTLDATEVQKELRILAIEVLNTRIIENQSMIDSSQNIIETAKRDYEYYKQRLENAIELLKHIEIKG